MREVSGAAAVGLNGFPQTLPTPLVYRGSFGMEYNLGGNWVGKTAIRVVDGQYRWSHAIKDGSNDYYIGESAWPGNI